MTDHRQAQQQDEQLSCSFCGKTAEDVTQLFAGPSSNICDECVEILGDALTDIRLNSGEPGEQSKALGLPSRCALCRRSVPATNLVAIAGRGTLCSPCIVAVRAIQVVGEGSDKDGE